MLLSARLVVLLTLPLAAAPGAEIPAGLLQSEPQSLTPPPSRDWRALGIRDWEIRLFERFHRGGGYEAYHVGYKSGDLNITGILARPYIADDQVKHPAILLSHGSEEGVTAPYRAVALELARRGYVVLASTYRGRQGPEGRSEGRREFGKGEVIDVLQLTELARKLDYVDTQRMGIIGEGLGGAITLQAIGRSNVFRAAVLISPLVFSGAPEHGFPGMRLFGARSEEFFGRQLSESELIRELRQRDCLRFTSRIKSAVLLIASEQDPGYQDQLRLVGALERYGIEHSVLRFPNVPADFMLSYDSGADSAEWLEARERAWAELFRFVQIYVPVVEETGPPRP
jgi:dipeptidyl aminopeptidase/acylaminoacyl peptidase